MATEAVQDPSLPPPSWDFSFPTRRLDRARVVERTQRLTQSLNPSASEVDRTFFANDYTRAVQNAGLGDTSMDDAQDEEEEEVNWDELEEAEEERDDDDSVTEAEMREQASMLQRGTDGIALIMQSPKRVPTLPAIEAQKAAGLIRDLWGAPTDAAVRAIVADVNKINDEIRRLTAALAPHAPDTDAAGAASQQRYDNHVIDIRGIKECQESIMHWIVLWREVTNVDDRKETARLLLQECLALVQPLDRCALEWKTITPPKIQQILSDIVQRSYHSLDPRQCELLGSLVARNAQAARFQVAIVEENSALESLIAAAKANDRNTVRSEYRKLAATNNLITKANRNAGFRPGDHVLPMDKIEGFVKSPTLWRLGPSAEVRGAYVNHFTVFMANLMRETGYVTMALNLRGMVQTSTSLRPEEQSYIDSRKLEYAQPLDMEYPAVGGTLFGPSRPPAGVPGPAASSATPSSTQQSVAPPATTGTNARSTNESAITAANSSSVPNVPAAQTTRSQTSTGPPQVRSMAGPCFDDGNTHLGKIVGVRAMKGPFRGYRVIVNVGTDQCPVYECKKGSDFGRRMGEELFNKHPLPAPTHLSERKPSHIHSISGLAEVARESDDHHRAPITYFLVHWNQESQRAFPGTPASDWITRSDAIAILGKHMIDNRTNGYRAGLLKIKAQMSSWLDECTSRGLDPDNGGPITEERKRQFPWLFAPSPQAEDIEPAQQAERRPGAIGADAVPNIQIGNNWSRPNDPSPPEEQS